MIRRYDHQAMQVNDYFMRNCLANMKYAKHEICET
jgi:hypothetical protein